MGLKVQKSTKKWANDGPFKLLEIPRKRFNIKYHKKEHGAITAGNEMCLIHNVMIRIMNCIYLQAPNVKLEQDIKDFTTFMHAFMILLHEHHRNEETYFFPWLEEDIGEKGYMSPMVDQHHAFGPGLVAFETYVDALVAGTESYSGEKVVKLLDGFGTILRDHLGEEITTFENLQKFGDKIDWKKWMKRVAKIAVGTADKPLEIPVVMTNMDLTFEKEYHRATWPPMPWFALLIFRWFYIPKNKGAWRFSCCDSKGTPKVLEFA